MAPNPKLLNTQGWKFEICAQEVGPFWEDYLAGGDVVINQGDDRRTNDFRFAF